MTHAQPITETTTLAELREQRLLLGVIAIRIYPSMKAWLEGAVDEQQGLRSHPLEASVHHRSGFYVGTGLTEATAIEAAFEKLRHALLSEPLEVA